MASDASYSYSLTTFSRSGKLLQIEYALTAVGEGKTSIGIKAKNGVVLITDKKIQNKLVDVQQVKKLEKVSPSVGAISASRRVVVCSLPWMDSCPSHFHEWMVSFSSLRPFGPRRATAMLRAGFVYRWTTAF